MVIIVILSVAGQVGVAVYLAYSTEGVALYVVFLLVLCGLIYHAVHSLEAVEAFKKKFDAAFAECAEGIESDSDALGPEPSGNPGLKQDGGRDVEDYIDEAKRLFKPFQRDVLGVLANAADPTGKIVTILSNLKGREVSPASATQTCSMLHHPHPVPPLQTARGGENKTRLWGKGG